MDKLRVAVIGAGRMGGFHAQKLATFPDVELIAVVDPAAAARQRLAAECQTRELDDYRSLVGQIDAAVIAAPSQSHHAVARELLQHGIHLLVEKPLCTRRDDADELLALAKRHEAVLQTGHVERFNPAYTAVAGQITEPKYIEAVRSSGYTFRSTDVGVVLDLMIHDIDLVLSLVHSPVRSVAALGFAVLGGHEDVASARIEFQCGCVAVLSASRVSYEPLRRMQIWSKQGFAALDFAARKTTLVRPSAALLNRRFRADRLTPTQVEHYKTHFFREHLPMECLEFDPVDAVLLELRQFVETIRHPQARLETASAGRDAVALADRVLDGIAHHAWDDKFSGAVGPLAVPAVPVIQAPEFAPATLEIVRKAG